MVAHDPSAGMDTSVALSSPDLITQQTSVMFVPHVNDSLPTTHSGTSSQPEMDPGLVAMSRLES
eukprot:m.155129 g.155129  ORF g.155129 m.155129 type:complete len:64 (+) comp16407_c0_seq4:1258-1449(+)